MKRRSVKFFHTFLFLIKNYIFRKKVEREEGEKEVEKETFSLETFFLFHLFCKIGFLKFVISPKPGTLIPQG